MRLAALVLLVACAGCRTAVPSLEASREDGASAVLADTLRLVPGHPALVTSWIAPGETQSQIRVIAPEVQDIGATSERVTVADGVVTRVVTLVVPAQRVRQTDSLRAEAATLAPLSHHTTSATDVLALEFSPESVVGMASGTPVVLPLDVPVFDASWMAEVAQSLPFAEGLVATAPAYDGQRGVVTVVLRVTGRAEASGPGAPEDAWIVEAAGPGGTTTYAVSAATRQLLRTRFAPQPGVTVEIVRRGTPPRD